MSEIRKDPASRTWVVIAPGRSKRPVEFDEEKAVAAAAPHIDPDCPLCFGHEDQTPPAVFELWPPGAAAADARWHTRVVGNKYPALEPVVELAHFGVGDFYVGLTGVGAHEVIVETPFHGEHLATMSHDSIRQVVRTYAERYRFWRNDPRIAYILIFKNWGQAAGASLVHSHSQLVATPVMPPRVSEELEEARRYFRYHRQCLYCKTLEVELADPSRVVYSNEHFVVHAAYAARFPYELRITPRRHAAALDELSDEEAEGFADALGVMTRSLYRNLGDPPYNYLVHAAPLRTPGLLYYHWHVEVIPRLAQPAGFEWGSGIYINTVAPEQAAAELREAIESGSQAGEKPPPETGAG
jgi:UDPglucose--hexose-1-phosphate uridylyltransferase